MKTSDGNTFADSVESIQVDAMGVKYVEKIHGLLSHDDIEAVQQGLTFLDSLVDS